MNKNFKRILAYMVDMVIVSIIVYGLTNIKQINFQLENYKKTYKQCRIIYQRLFKLLRYN